MSFSLGLSLGKELLNVGFGIFNYSRNLNRAKALRDRNKQIQELTVDKQISDYENLLKGQEDTISIFDDKLQEGMSSYLDLKAQHDKSLEMLGTGVNSLSYAQELGMNTYNTNAKLQAQNLAQQGISNYTQLMSNWGRQQTINTERGQSGGSASLFSEIQKEDVKRYVGENMKLDNNGGIYSLQKRLQEYQIEKGANALARESNIAGETLRINERKLRYGTYAHNEALKILKKKREETIKAYNEIEKQYNVARADKRRNALDEMYNKLKSKTIGHTRTYAKHDDEYSYVDTETYSYQKNVDDMIKETFNNKNYIDLNYDELGQLENLMKNEWKSNFKNVFGEKTHFTSDQSAYYETETSNDTWKLWKKEKSDNGYIREKESLDRENDKKKKSSTVRTTSNMGKTIRV